jgi:hypothetical protein
MVPVLTPVWGLKTLISNKLKFTENEDFSCLFDPFFGTIFFWKMVSRSREADAPEAGIFLSVNGHDTRKVHR